MPELAMLNGEIMPIAEARIPVEDRGFLFGDGVYEVVVSYHGRLFLLDEHMARFRRSLDAIGMAYVPLPPLVEQIHRAFDAAGFARAKIYIQVTRGAAPRNHAFPSPPVEPNVVIMVREFPPVEESFFQEGVFCITHPDIRWGRVDVKTVNLLPNCLAKQAASERGCYEAILVAADGIVTEATAANAFFVRGQTVFTHPENERILGGITRHAVLELCRQAGLEVVEEAASIQQWRQADELFLSGTTAEVMPVVRLDDQPIGDGRPGPVSRRLLALFREWIDRADGDE